MEGSTNSSSKYEIAERHKIAPESSGVFREVTLSANRDALSTRGLSMCHINRSMVLCKATYLVVFIPNDLMILFNVVSQ